MTRRMNNKSKVIKVVSIALSVYMALSPVALHADELVDVEENLSAQDESVDVDEAADYVEEAVESAAAVSVEQAQFENVVAENTVPATDAVNVAPEYTLEDTSALIEAEINRIENEAIQEVANEIINVDMSDVNAALGKVTDLVDETLTDEAVADGIVNAAEALITVYETQAEVALEALKAISANQDVNAVVISENGSVSVDWDKATKDVQKLYQEYLDAVDAKNVAELARDEAVANQKSISDTYKTNSEIINKNKEINEKISESKLNKDEIINNIIDDIAANQGKSLAAGKNIDGIIDGNDMYRYYINTIEDGIKYGCLTYYDSVNKTILRKNFSIEADGSINHAYVPKSEWVKEDPECITAIFGNGSNYVAAYLGNQKSPYISNDTFNGTKVSDIMRPNIELNDAIDARNTALTELEKIIPVVEKAETELQTASENAANALEKYKAVVAMYKDVASLQNEIKKDEIEIAMLEYVKAEVDVYKKQQALNQIKEAVNNDSSNDDTSDTADTDVVATQENIETVISGIARDLGVEPAIVENLVVQAIIDTEDNYTVAANNGNATAAGVAGVRRDIEEVAQAEKIENTKVITENESVDEAQELVTIIDEEVPLANSFAVDTSRRVNWVLPLVIMLICASYVLFIVAKKNKKDEEANA